VPTHVPDLHWSGYVQSTPSLHPVVSGLGCPSTQTGAPVVQEMMPNAQVFRLFVQLWPMAQGMQLPWLSQTLLVPQLLPGGLTVLLLQTVVPVVQLVMFV
jgi:hypothetical protein